MANKILLFIVEGISDELALGYTLNKLIDKSKVKFRIVNCDLTTHRYTTQANALIKVAEQIDIFLDEK